MRANIFVPALLRYAGSASRMDAWGRLLKITAGGADISTAAKLERGELVHVRFELGSEQFGLAARVDYTDKDDDGHCVAELRWIDPVQRRALARALLDVLSRNT